MYELHALVDAKSCVAEHTFYTQPFPIKKYQNKHELIMVFGQEKMYTCMFDLQHSE